MKITHFEFGISVEFRTVNVQRIFGTKVIFSVDRFITTFEVFGRYAEGI